jgi:benzoate/toluate 1,2-dioxygenase reductase component
MLAGGTGLAPFLSMLLWLKDNPTDQPITLAYGVNSNADLVELGTLAELKSVMPNLEVFTVVVDKASGHPRLGYVTDHLGPQHLNDGEVDVYVCGPPPMVEGVRKWMAGCGVTPRNFLFEKFSSSSEGAS